MIRGDLHLHSALSDGADSVGELLRRVTDNHLEVVSLVDHDTVAGVEYAVRLGEERGVKVIPGVEISAYDGSRRRKVHILGYNFSLPARNVETLCNPLRAARDRMTRWQLEVIAAAGFPLTLGDMEGLLQGLMPPEELALRDPVLYKQHIMAVLVGKGAARSIYGALYRELFKGTGVAAGEIDYPEATDAVKAVKADGGIAVLAHPGQQNSFDLLPSLLAAGLDGIELFHEDHTPEHRQMVKELARAHGLLLTGGSDYHGSYGTSPAPGAYLAPPSTLRSFGPQQISN